MKDIAKEVAAEEADPYELAQWLWNYFDGEFSSTAREIRVRKNSIEIVRIEFSRSHRLMGFKIASRTTQQEIVDIRNAINRDLLSQTGRSVGTEVLFSSFPVDGHFKFEDKLQILPVPPEAPRVSGRAWGEHPFLLEFEFPASRNVFVTSFRASQAARHLGVLLAVFLEGAISVRSKVLRGHWVNVPGEKHKMESKYLGGQYICPGLKMQSSSFSQIDGYSAITQIPEQVYYTRWDQVLGRALEIPDCLDKLFKLFFSLPVQKRRRFVRSAYWFGQASSAYLISKSYSYIALVMAIETLVEQSSVSEQCPTCKRTQGNGPTKNFQQFLDEYAPDFEGANTLKREFYDLRCDLSHGSRLFLEDIDDRPLSLTPRMVEDQHKSELLYRLTRIALINWLCKEDSSRR